MKTISDPMLAAMLGPMEGVMRAPFISALRRLDLIELPVTPFLRVSEHPLKQNLMRRFLAPWTEDGAAVILQLMGDDPEKLAETARRAADCGVAGINLNFGCPSGQVVASGGGSAVLRRPGLAGRLLRAVRTAVPDCSVSVKTRIGFTDVKEAEPLLRMLVAEEPDFLVVHCRTRAEYYAPVEDLNERRRRVLDWTRGVRVVLNGDFNTAADAREWIGRGASGVMCARGFLHDPWLLKRICGAADVPEAEAGRMLFFRAALEAGEHSGLPYLAPQAIELSNLIWGAAENPFWERLVELAKKKSSLPIGLDFCAGR